MGKELIIAAIALFVAAQILDYFRPYDDTDDELNRVRSGMQLFTDNKTGCQYLKGSYFAELTKRVDGNGRHVGCN
jgi:hypothetical protein